MTTKSLAITLLIFMGVFLFACQPSDGELKKEVNEKLSLIPGITAEVKSGVVTLSGEVSDEVAKATAQDALKNLKGVKSVKDDITVKAAEPVPAPVIPNPDELLKKTLDSTYAANGFTDITVTVNNGEITLEGAAKKKEKDDIVEIATQSTLKKVINKIKTKK